MQDKDKEAQVQKLAQTINDNITLAGGRARYALNSSAPGTSSLVTIAAFIRTLPVESIKEIQDGDNTKKTELTNAIVLSIEAQIGNVVDGFRRPYTSSDLDKGIAHFETKHKQNFVKGLVIIGEEIAAAVVKENKKLNLSTLQAQLDPVILSTMDPKQVEIAKGLAIGMIQKFASQDPYKDMVEKTSQLPEVLTVAIVKAASDLVQRDDYQHLDQASAIAVGQDIGRAARESIDLSPQVIQKQAVANVPKDKSMISKVFGPSVPESTIDTPLKVVSDVGLQKNIVKIAISDIQVDKTLKSQKGYSPSASSSSSTIPRKDLNIDDVTTAHKGTTVSVDKKLGDFEKREQERKKNQQSGFERK